MTKNTVFIQVQGRHGVIEALVAEEATLGELHEAIALAGVLLEAEMHLFLDDAEEPLRGDHGRALRGLRHGSRLHVARCKHIATTVHYLERTAEHRFPPGARVRAVKAWAARTFSISPTDAAEHVLQICSSTQRPAADTPLHELVHGHACALCFDFVPEKRVEGSR